MWPPIELNKLRDSICASEAIMDEVDRRLWELIRIEPAKWQQHPWGDRAGGFWAVGLIGTRVIWYNDIEGGFNVSRFHEFGMIDEYWCQQDELHHTMHFLSLHLASGEPAGQFGSSPPAAGTGDA